MLKCGGQSGECQERSEHPVPTPSRWDRLDDRYGIESLTNLQSHTVTLVRPRTDGYWPLGHDNPLVLILSTSKERSSGRIADAGTENTMEP